MTQTGTAIPSDRYVATIRVLAGNGHPSLVRSVESSPVSVRLRHLRSLVLYAVICRVPVRAETKRR